MVHHARVCDDCAHVVRGDNLDQFCDAFVDHHSDRHPELAFPDVVLRNFAAATQRLAEPGPRRQLTGSVRVQPVMPDCLDPWLDFFDHTAYAGNPLDAACYCTGPHLLRPGQPGGMRPWQDNRRTMADLLRTGRTFGYLAFADDSTVGWLNASFRSVCLQHPDLDPAAPPANKIISLSCITIAPEFRGNGIARTMIERALDDASERGAEWVEAYPSAQQHAEGRLNFRGRRHLYEELGFDMVAEGPDSLLMRRAAR